MHSSRTCSQFSLQKQLLIYAASLIVGETPLLHHNDFPMLLLLRFYMLNEQSDYTYMVSASQPISSEEVNSKYVETNVKKCDSVGIYMRR